MNRSNAIGMINDKTTGVISQPNHCLTNGSLSTVLKAWENQDMTTICTGFDSSLSILLWLLPDIFEGLTSGSPI